MRLLVIVSAHALAGAGRTLIHMLWAMLSEVLALLVGAVAAHPFLAASGMLVAVFAGVALSRWPALDHDA